MTHQQLQVEYPSIETIRPDPMNPRLHRPKQLRQLVASIRRFGFTNPIPTDDAGHVVAGHGRLEAAWLAGLARVPVIRLGSLEVSERRALMVADNRLAETSSWDPDRLQEVLRGLVALDVAVDDLGFDAGELDRVLGHGESASVVDDADMVEAPDPEAVPIARPGDVFGLGDHLLSCMDARDERAYEAVLGGAQAQLVFTDPPYNVPIEGHVSGARRNQAWRLPDGVGRDVGGGVHRLPADGAEPPGAGQCGWRDPVRLHGLAAYRGAARGGEGPARRQEPVRLG